MTHHNLNSNLSFYYDTPCSQLLTSHVFYTSSHNKTENPLQYTKTHYGKIDGDEMEKIVPKPIFSNEYYICGSDGFLENMRNILENSNVPKSQMNYECFAPFLQ